MREKRITMSIQKLIDTYAHWLKEEIVFKKMGEFYEITTPFYNNANDKFPYGKPQTDEVARGSGTESMAVRD